MVLNNQIPTDQDNDNLDFRRQPPRPLRPLKRPLRPRPQSYFYYRQRNSPRANFLYYEDPRPSWPSQRPQRPPQVQRRLGFFDSESSKSEDNYVSASSGGCCGGGGGSGDISSTEALIFLAALAFAVAFLNQQITMFLGGGGRKRRRRNIEDNFKGKLHKLQCLKITIKSLI